MLIDQLAVGHALQRQDEAITDEGNKLFMFHEHVIVTVLARWISQVL